MQEGTLTSLALYGQYRSYIRGSRTIIRHKVGQQVEY